MSLEVNKMKDEAKTKEQLIDELSLFNIRRSIFQEYTEQETNSITIDNTGTCRLL